MMNKVSTIKNHLKKLKLRAMSDSFEEVITWAETEKPSYTELAKVLLEKEISHRQEKDLQQRRKLANLPLSYNLDNYDHSQDNGLQKQQLNQLRELNWLDKNFNIVLMGPSGVGKTYLAAGLCFDAVAKGYRTYFKTMEELLKTLKLKDITRTAAIEYKRIMKAHLLVIDDIMMFPFTKEEALSFFNLINDLHDKASLIITTNKSPKEWADVLQDTVIATAILDRILYRCEIIKLTGNSYRMTNRKTIFEQQLN